MATSACPLLPSWGTWVLRFLRFKARGLGLGQKSGVVGLAAPLFGCEAENPPSGGLDLECHLALLVVKYQPGPFPWHLPSRKVASHHGWASRNAWPALFLGQLHSLSTSLAKGLPCPALALGGPRGPEQHVQEVGPESFSHGVGRLHPGHRLLGELEVAPRYTVLWLPASEIQTGTFPTGRGKGGALGNAVATRVTFTECLFLLCPATS